MKSSFLLLSGASIALAGPVKPRVLDVVVETDVVYYTVTNEVTVFETEPAVDPNVNVAATPTPAETPPPTTEAPVVTVTQTAAAETSPAAAEVASSSTPSSAAVSSPSDFVSTAVYQHNIHRANNSAVDVTYDETYANYAAQLAAGCVFEHNVDIGGGGYGQNIAMYASTDAESLGEETAIAQAITNMWYNGEIDLFPSSGYGEAQPDTSDFDAWGHYSQVVWNSSNILGCAVQYCKPGTMEPTMGAWFSVCNYYPAGNVEGEYGENVFKPLGKSTVTA